MRNAMVFLGVVSLGSAVAGSAQSVKPQGSAAAAKTFAGTWKIDYSRTKLTGEQDRIEAAGTNTWKFTSGTLSWTLPADGAFHPGPLGGFIALTAKGPREWEMKRKVNDLLVENDQWTLSEDGKTMTRVASGPRANGEHYSETVTVRRVAGKEGFAGTWESVDVKPAIAEMRLADLDNGLKMEFPADKMTIDCLLDGKPHEVVSPAAPKGFTLTCRKANGGAIAVDQAMNGKVISTSEWRLSADGKTLTMDWHNAGQPKPIMMVFARH